MKKTQPIGAIVGCFLGLGLAVNIAQGEERGTCSISDGKVVCAESVADRKAVFDAMSNPKSVFYFNNLLRNPDFSLDVNRRETYRRSLERNRRSMDRYARAQLRALRRGKISSAEYEKTVSGYKSAVATYTAAMHVYRGTVWHSKTKSRFEE
jgi:hypothetical protein